jgi:putative transposase
LLRKVLHSKPAAATHWSVRSVAAHTGISKSTVARYFALFGLPPHRSKSFKLSTEPLEHTQPVLPMGLGYVEGVTHDYYRHGTTTRLAALDIVDGGVISQCKPRHRHQECLSFLQHLDAHIPADLEMPLIADNYATHKHPKVKAWLARHPRYRIHFTPTYSSWLNQIERWFALITQQAIRRGSFRNVRELVGKIDAYVAHYNAHKRPFVWTATADSIFDKLQRICKLFNGTQH